MTRLQQRNLQLYLQFRERPITTLSLLWANRRGYTVLLFAFGGSAVFIYSAFGNLGLSFVAVAYAFIMLRDIGHFRRTAAIWPVLQQVLDWDKIEQLASSNEAESDPERVNQRDPENR